MYAPVYRLLKEARETWDYVVCDKLVYCLDVSQVALDVPVLIAKNYSEFGNPWIERHLTLKRQRELHYCIVTEFCEAQRLIHTGRDESVPRHNATKPVDGDSGVFVDVAKFIKSPQQILVNCLRRRCVVWLKRFDDAPRLCGYTVCLPVESRDVLLLKDRKLGALGVTRGGIDFRQTPNQLVKGRTEAVEKVTEDKRNVVRDVLHLTFSCALRALMLTMSLPKIMRRSRRSSRCVFALAVLRYGSASEIAIIDNIITLVWLVWRVAHPFRAPRYFLSAVANHAT